MTVFSQMGIITVSSLNFSCSSSSAVFCFLRWNLTLITTEIFPPISCQLLPSLRFLNSPPSIHPFLYPTNCVATSVAGVCRCLFPSHTGRRPVHHRANSLISQPPTTPAAGCWGEAASVTGSQRERWGKLCSLNGTPN